MKRLLSVILSFSLMFALTSNISEAGTAGLNSQKEFSAVSSKDGRSFWMKGKNCSPYININNNNKAISNSSSKSESDSKSSSTSNGGGSGIGPKILLGLAFFLGWKAYSLKNSIGGGFSAAIDKATDWFQNFGGNNQSGTDRNSGQNGNQGNSESGTDQNSGQNGNQGNSESGTDQGSGQSGSKGDLESETDQLTGQNGSQESQPNAETEGGARFDWGDISLKAVLLWLNTQIRMLSSKFVAPSIDPTNPLFQAFF